MIIITPTASELKEDELNGVIEEEELKDGNSI